MLGLAVILAVHLLGLIFTFFALCIICDNHLIPTVEVFIKQFNVPEEIAAVTLVAFGSAAPELLLNSVSAIANTSDLSLSAILGSGMIAFGLIPPLCIIGSQRTEIKFQLPPILRECSFYVLGLLLFLIFIWDERITMNEALCISLVYCSYVALVVSTYFFSSRNLEQRQVQYSPVLSPVSSIAMQAFDDAISSLDGAHAETFNHHNDPHFVDSDMEIDIEAAVTTSSGNGPLARTIEILTRVVSSPLRRIFNTVIPALHGPTLFRPMEHGILHDSVSSSTTVPLWRALSSLLMSIVCISAFASIIIFLSQSLISQLGLTMASVGATLVAFGSEIPDALTSIALARSGYFDGALAGAIGSQVINISLGVGVPAFFVAASGGHNGALRIDKQDARSLWILACLLLVVISSYMMLVIPITRITSTRALPEFTSINKSE